ncbi:MAG: hypothetical protein AAFO91_15630, partial [Bacteroidota bacterium]
MPETGSPTGIECGWSAFITFLTFGFGIVPALINTAAVSIAYLQGRYEVQLLDSWGKKEVSYGDCGGIYQRWDDTKP